MTKLKLTVVAAVVLGWRAPQPCDADAGKRIETVPQHRNSLRRPDVFQGDVEPLVEKLTRGRDEVEVQRFHFATGCQRVSTRDSHVNVVEIRGHVFRPGIAAGLRFDGFR